MAQAFPSRLQDMFAAEGYGEVEVLNAGVSGDTTAGGLRRVESVLAPNVRILLVALGGNDALRGLSATQTRENLAAIIEGSLQRGVRVMLAGMEAPTNLGEDYRTAFRGAFTQLASEYRGRISVVPFLLEGVAADPALNQADGIHPNEQGAKLVAEHLYPTLRDMVDQIPTPGA
jgi:acyl-CoA thioesterase-1